MTRKWIRTLLPLVLGVVSGNVYAIDPFTPLTAPAVTGIDTWVLPENWNATKITDRNTLSSQPGWQSNFRSWDMVDVGGPNHEFIYIPFEFGFGAGVVRYNRDTGTSTTLLGGNGTRSFSSDPASWSATTDDFGAIDPAVLTPKGSLLVAEEWSGNGRMFEITNPQTASGTATANVQWLSNIPSVSHEGIKFDSQGRMYFIDENNSGSLYRLTPTNPGDLTLGKVDVLSVNDFAGNAAQDFNSGINASQPRTGAASWLEIVDSSGAATTAADPFDFTGRGGRTAADEVNGTPFGRPEDMVIGTMNGQEIVYFATTSEHIVYGVNLLTNEVFEAVNNLVTPDNLGNDPVGSGSGISSVYGLFNPDNLEATYGPGGELQLWVLEDQNPGDIWMATDTNSDGVMDFVDLFASLGIAGAEPTGFIVDPRGGFLVNVQHPADGNDSLWRFSQSTVPVPPAAWLFGSALGILGWMRRKAA
jgi:hypothetical protein